MTSPHQPGGRPRLPRAIALAAAFVLAGAGSAHAWLLAVDGDLAASDHGHAVVLDDAGSSIAAGVVNDADGGAIVVVKRDPDGHELWRQRLFGSLRLSGEGGPRAAAVAVDTLGDVVLLGVVPDVGRDLDVLVAKLSGTTGAELWRAVLDGDGHLSDRAAAVALAGSDVLVAATLLDGDHREQGLFVRYAGGDGTEQWRTRIAGTTGRGTASGVAVAPGGEVVVAATVSNVGHGYDWLVARLDGATGIPPSPPTILDEGAFDEVRALAVDAGGNAVAAGRIEGGADADFAVVKLSPAGTQLWRRLVAGSGSGGDDALAVAVDFSGDVLAAGRVGNADSGRDFTVVKLRWSDGALLWSHTLVGTADRDDEAVAITVDAGGDVLASGFLNDVGTGRDFAVARFDRDGPLVWLRLVARGGDGDAREIAAEAGSGLGGDVVVGTVIGDSGTPDIRTMRMAGPSGTVIWRHDLHGSGHDAVDVGRALAVDAYGGAVAAGSTQHPDSGRDFAVVAADGATGALRWSRHLAGSLAGGEDVANAVAVDAAGDVVACGRLANDASGDDFAVVKLGRADGAEAWRSVLTRSDAGLEDSCRAVAIAGGSDAVAAGEAYLEPGQRRFVVRRLDGASGAERWTQATTVVAGGWLDGARAVAVHATGDVVAAGRLYAGPIPEHDFAVVRLDGAAGGERWRALYDGGGTDDEALATAVDAAGDVVAAGWLGVPGAARRGFVVKLGGADGAERWQYRLDAAGGEPGAGLRSLAVDAAGDVLAAGTLSPDAGVDMAVVVKLSGASGAELWRVVLTDGGTGGDSRDASVAVDAAGDALVFASLARVAGAPLPRWLLAKLTGAGGVPRWYREITGTTARADAVALALDAGGNPVVAGTLGNAGRMDDLCVAKVSGGTGTDAFCGDGRRDDGERCDDGNAAAGDCCSPACEPVEVPGACGTPCAGADDCDDRDPCTTDGCDATSHCAHAPVTGDAAITCGVERPLDDPACARVPRRLGRAFARAGRLVTRAVQAQRPTRRARAYAAAARALAGLARAIDRAERARRPRRHLEPACAAALRAVVSDARARVLAASG